MVFTTKSHSYTLCTRDRLEISKYVHYTYDSAKYGHYKYQQYNPIWLK